jgi:outer membrane protein
MTPSVPARRPADRPGRRPAASPAQGSVLVLALCGLCCCGLQQLGAEDVPFPAGGDRGMPPAGSVAAVPSRLDLGMAHHLALVYQPRLTVADLEERRAAEQVRMAESAYYPQIAGVGTAARTANRSNTRISAGGLNNPLIYDRDAVGLEASQLIIDFGRTSNLVASSRHQAAASRDQELATRLDVLSDVDAAYFADEAARASLQVAETTVRTRRLVAQRAHERVVSRLASTLDESFAQLDLQQALLLLSDVKRQVQDADVRLGQAMGFVAPLPAGTVLVPSQDPPDLPLDSERLAQLAIAMHPEITRLQDIIAASRSDERAAIDSQYPEISAVGATGLAREHDPHMANDYAAGALEIQVPLFTGFQISAFIDAQRAERRANEARLRAAMVDLAATIRTEVSTLGYDQERLRLARQEVVEAQQALTLAQTRFNLGLSSIIETSQAEVAETRTELDVVSARFACQQSFADLVYHLGREVDPDTAATLRQISMPAPGQP